MAHKPGETTHNINNTFGPGTANKYTKEWWLWSFAEDMRALKMRSIVAGYQKLTTTTESNHRSWSSYNFMRSCWGTQHWLVYGYSALEANRKGEKVRRVGASWADLKLKNHCSEVLSSLILHNNDKPFLDQTVMCDKKWIVYNKRWPAQWLDQKEAPKHFPKPNLHQKKSWSLFGGLLPVWFTTTF